jgi:O-antigen ligase
MNQLIATIACVAVIIGLFVLDRDTTTRTSKALWIPLLWMLINGSRPVSMWSQNDPTNLLAVQYTECSPVDAAVYGILIATAVLVLISRSRQVQLFLQKNGPILVFFSYCLLSISWSDYSLVGLKRWIKAFGDFAMILIILTDPNSQAAMRRFFSRASFILMPASLLLIKFYPALGRTFNQWTWIPMYTGVTTNKNSLGVICMVCGLGSLWSLIGTYEQRMMPRRLARLIAHGSFVALSTYLIVKADSMTSLSCLVMGGVVMVMTTQKWIAGRASGVNALVAGSIALPLVAVFVSSAGELLQSLGRNSTLTGRTGIWKAVLSLHTNPLVGTGFETFWLGERLQRVWDMTEKGIQEAHNGYLEVYLNLGWIGVVLMIGLIVVGYRHALAIFRYDPQAGRLRLAFITAGVIYSLTEAGFRMMNPIWIALLLTTTCIPASLRVKNRQQVTKHPAVQAALRRQTRILQ